MFYAAGRALQFRARHPPTPDARGGRGPRQFRNARIAAVFIQP